MRPISSRITLHVLRCIPLLEVSHGEDRIIAIFFIGIDDRKWFLIVVEVVSSSMHAVGFVSSFCFIHAYYKSFFSFSSACYHAKVCVQFYFKCWYSVSLGILTIWSAWLALPGQDSYWMSLGIILRISIGNSMICSDIWHKYHEWYFNIVIRDFTSRLGEWNLRQFWNITSGIYAKYRVQIMLLFVYTSTRKRFAILYVRISN